MESTLTLQEERERALCAIDFSFIACTLRRVKIDEQCMHSKPKRRNVWLHAYFVDGRTVISESNVRS
jgi:hypothetical protein